jgi:NAD(P) transhydrogenase subunit alpha
MVLKAMSNLHKSLPMMMTPAGTLKPAKVFIIGAGVAGLQAIATAKRMGASVIAYDTRAEVAQQVQSLGAKFLNIDLGDTESTDQGYAKALSAEQLILQQQAQADCIASSDIVITTAQLFGRKPPLLISNEVTSRMRPGSVIVDMAAQDGGNVEASVAGKTVIYEFVKVIGDGDWAGEVALDASQMYANNLQALVQDMWNSETSMFTVNAQDDVLKLALVTYAGEVINPILKSQYSKETA